MCFNEEGKIKIWVNHNLGLSVPVIDLNNREYPSSKIIVNNMMQIISMIEKKCFNTSLLRNFIKKIN